MVPVEVEQTANRQMGGLAWPVGAAYFFGLREPHDILGGEASHFRCQSAWLHPSEREPHNF